MNLYSHPSRPQTTQSSYPSQYKSRQEEFSQPFYQSFVESQLLERAQQKERQVQQERQRQSKLSIKEYDFSSGRYPPYNPVEYARLANPHLPPATPPEEPLRTMTSAQKFIAGPAVLEKNPLSQPMSTIGSVNYANNPELASSQASQIQSQIEERNYDIYNPDNQFLRYKHMMNSQFYNSQANSVGYQQSVNTDKLGYGEIYGDTKKRYDVPPHFRLAELQTKQREDALKAFKQSQEPQAREIDMDPLQRRHLKPQTVSIYQLPQQQKAEQPMAPQPQYYRSIQQNQSVRMDVIDALGGLEDVVKPMEDSLRMHEMRPFDLEPNYYEDLMQSRNFQQNLRNQQISRAQSGLKGNYFTEEVDGTSRSEFLKKTMSDRNFMQTNTKIVSASPYRAVVRRQEPLFPLQQTSREDSDDDEDNDGDGNDDFDRDQDPLDMGATGEMQMQNQDLNQPSYQAFGDKYSPSADAFGEQGTPMNQAGYLSNLDQMPGYSLGDGKEVGGDISMYSYSKVSQNLKEESQMMRQLRDQQLASKTLTKRNESPTSLGAFARKEDQFRAIDENSSFPKIRAESRNQSSLLDRLGSGTSLEYPLRQSVNGVQVTQQQRQGGDVSISLTPSPNQEEKNQSIRMQSALLRQQRELFLKNFG